MRARRLVIALTTAAMVAPPAYLLTTAHADNPGPLGTSCTTTTSNETTPVTYQFCTGEVASFDGTNLDTDITLPANWTPASGPLPTIVMLHGWSGDKHDWEATTTAGDGADSYHWNNVWFAGVRGFAVINYTARGFKESCGILDQNPPTDIATCAKTGTHLADRRWEVRDSQTLLSDLIHAGVADPNRLAATGGSYGGGQSWLLATSLPWDATTPSGSDIKVQLAAAVPKYPWTDLLYSLTPNGRATDAPYKAEMETNHSTPFGIPKASYVAGLYAVGRATGQGRYDPVDGLPDNPSTNLDVSFVRTIAVGEPYDPDPVLQLFTADYRNRSAYYADDYFDAVKAKTANEVPVFSINGWTDPLFPPVETLQMYRKLKSIDPNWVVDMAFGDVGHSNAQNPSWQWQHINNQANQFLGTFLLGQGNSTPTSSVFAFYTDCHDSTGVAPDNSVPSGTSWDNFTSHFATLTSDSGRTTTSANTNPQTGLAVDPILHKGCLTTPSSSSDADTTWTWAVPQSGIKMLGLPDLSLDYAMVGADATVGFYLWDVAPSGTRTLVTRGEWRIATLGGDPLQGEIHTKLNGNGWIFAAGHKIELQVTQTDTPYLRPDNLPSSVSFVRPLDQPLLKLPIADANDVTLQEVP